MKLVIVESPTKAKTLTGILPKDYKIEASMGHIRDLPKSGLGVDVENNFEPEYAIPAKAKKVISKIKKESKDAEKIILATDPDREGEAIAWHLKEILDVKGNKASFGRATFHELTKEAIEQSFQSLSEIDLALVDAQKARRVLDRLVGYKLSPLLWKKVRYGLSAGRVQSVAVRLIVEKERDREKFNSEEYWTMDGMFKDGDRSEFKARLVKSQNKNIKINNSLEAKKIENILKEDSFTVSDIQKTEKKRNPYPPLKTSTLQQAMANIFGFPAKRTMSAAQSLFEKGYITYHRTDSFSLSADFINQTRNLISKEIGEGYIPDKPNLYKSTGKHSQEAHEAVRPTSVVKIPNYIKKELSNDEYKTYSIIWKRAVESQMLPVVYDQTSVDIISEGKFLFKTTGSLIKFAGWFAIDKLLGSDKLIGGETDEVETNEEEIDLENSENNNKYSSNLGYAVEGQELPKIKVGEKLQLTSLTSDQHFTQPPARYTDASLIKKLEELGIGRPSTYAPTISTIQARGYVEKDGRSFVPADVAFVVTDLLTEHFKNIVDYNFTADMEDSLDEIAGGTKQWAPVIKDFYEPFVKEVDEKDKTLSKSEVTNLGEIDEKCPECGKNLIVKLGKYGKFVSCSGYPECKYAKPLSNGESNEEEQDFGKCDKCEDGVFVLKHGRFGKFLACSNYPKCKNTKPFLEKIGVKCPECKDGDIVVKKAKGRKFYGCSNYPECKWSSWKNPVGKKSKKRDSVTTLV